MTPLLNRILGPRIPEEDFKKRPFRYLLPNLLFTLAAVSLIISVFFPFWRMDLKAPQYPRGLELIAYVDHIGGDVEELDLINHYIGMRPLQEAAKFEMSIAYYVMSVFALFLLAGTVIHTRWTAWLSLPAFLFPAAFILDMRWYMREFGMNLDPKAPLSSSVDPFVPTILGEGEVAQFTTLGYVDIGFWLALGSSVLIIFALWSHWAVWSPLVRKEEGKSN